MKGLDDLGDDADGRGLTRGRLRELAETLVVGLILNRDGRRRVVLRKALFKAAHVATPTVLVRGDEVSYLVDTSDLVVGRETFATGAYEEALMAKAFCILECYGHTVRGLAFIDIGANIGTSTIPALLRFGAARALAVEPEPNNFRLLQCNILINGLADRVQTVQVGASDQATLGYLSLSPHNSGDHRAHRTSPSDPAHREGREITEIGLERLDDLILRADLDPGDVGVVWVDSQGFEGYILAGATSLIARNVPFVCEYWPYGLRNAGNLDLFHERVMHDFNLVIDLRRGGTEGQPRVLPASEVRQLEGLYRGRTYTDLILVKDQPRARKQS